MSDNQNSLEITWKFTVKLELGDRGLLGFKMYKQLQDGQLEPISPYHDLWDLLLEECGELVEIQSAHNDKICVDGFMPEKV